MDNTIMQLTDNAIADSVRSVYPDIEVQSIETTDRKETNRYIDIYITVHALHTEIKLIERIYLQKSSEPGNYVLLNEYNAAIPKVFRIDREHGILLTEDLSGGYIRGNQFNENTEAGEFIRGNIYALLDTAAGFHESFWENYTAFGKIGLDWRLANKNNLLNHIDAMERDFFVYLRNEKNGEIPEEWHGMRNRIERRTQRMRDYFPEAADILRKEYVDLIETRFNKGKHITLIHGDLHPGNMFLSKTEKQAKLIDLEAVRIGLCTEDLAMLLALHIEPGQNVYQLLRYYHKRLCEKVSGYTFEMLLKDYRISVMENMFFPIRLINQKIYDFNMRDRAIKAFETFEG